MWPNVIVPLQIDVAIDTRRYLGGPPGNPGAQHRGVRFRCRRRRRRSAGAEAVDEPADLEDALGCAGESGDDDVSVVVGQQVRPRNDTSLRSSVTSRAPRARMWSMASSGAARCGVELPDDREQPGVGGVDALLPWHREVRHWRQRSGRCQGADAASTAMRSTSTNAPPPGSRNEARPDRVHTVAPAHRCAHRSDGLSRRRRGALSSLIGFRQPTSRA
jgi:hypothetical protein